MTYARLLIRIAAVSAALSLLAISAAWAGCKTGDEPESCVPRTAAQHTALAATTTTTTTTLAPVTHVATRVAPAPARAHAAAPTPAPAHKSAAPFAPATPGMGMLLKVTTGTSGDLSMLARLRGPSILS